MVRTIERRFDLRSSQTGILISMNDIMQSTTIVFIGYAVPKIHTPRFMSLAMMFSTLGMLLCASPFFIYGARFPDGVTSSSIRTSSQIDGTNGTHHDKIFAELCVHEEQNYTTCDADEDISNNIGTTGDHVLTILLIAGICTGLGHSGIQILSLGYIADNVSPVDVSIYVGMSYIVFIPLGML